MTLSTDVKTHVIITYKGSHHFITSQQEQALTRLTNDSQIRIDGNTIRGGDIAEVLTTEKYYESFPEKEKLPGPAYADIRALSGNVFTRSKSDGRKIMLDAMKRKYPDAPVLKLIGTKVKTGDTYKPQHIFDYKNESWEEFKNRAGVEFSN